MSTKVALWMSALGFSQAFLIGCATEQTVQVKSPEALTKVRRVAVVHFSDCPGYQAKNSGQAVAGFIVGRIAQSSRFKLVERSKVKALIDEKDLQLSSMSDPSTAARFGKLLGVDAVVIGSVSEYEHHRGSIPAYYTSVPTSEYTISATLRMVNVSDGEVIYAATGSGKSGGSFAQAGKQLADKLLRPILD